MNERQEKKISLYQKRKFSHMRFLFVYVTDTHESTAEKKHLHLYENIFINENVNTHYLRKH